MPGRAASLHVAPPDTSAVTEPSFASDLELALTRQLGRRGVILRDGTGAALVLHSRVVSTEAEEVVVQAGRAASDRLAVALVCWITDRRGQAIWRSPILEENRLRPLQGTPGEAEAARVSVLRSLAARLASRVVALLLADGQEPSRCGGNC